MKSIRCHRSYLNDRNENPCISKIGTAAELRIIKQGSGFGTVFGEGIRCGTMCQANYPLDTVVHLTARPHTNSRFVGWRVAERPHDGILIMREDVVITAIFELIDTGDDVLIWWYNGDTKEQGTMVFDEMVIFLQDIETWDVETQEDFEQELQRITHYFHPNAVITEAFGNSAMVLKSPEPLEKEVFFTRLSSFSDVMYVEQVSPVLYQAPGEFTSRVFPTGSITVEFLRHASKDQIHSLEEQYHLIQVEELDFMHNTIIYQTENPLASIDIANRLYTSGEVRYAYPNLNKHISLDF